VPELPEVGILKEELRREVVGRRVEVVGVFVKKEGEFPVAQLREAVEGRAIVEVRRRGKMHVLHFEGGHSLVIHLMMVGQLLLSPPFTGEPHDICLRLKFADGARLTLGQVGLKYVHLLSTAEVDNWPPVVKLTADPLDDSKGEPCFVCATPIERVEVGGRGTYFCPRCQVSYQSSSSSDSSQSPSS